MHWDTTTAAQKQNPEFEPLWSVYSSCLKQTGETCKVTGCRDWRKAICSADKKCVCRDTQCSYGGHCGAKLVPPPCNSKPCTSTVMSRDCNPKNHFSCSTSGTCVEKHVSWDCACAKGFNGASCDSGGGHRLFGTLPFERQQDVVVAVEASALVYWTDPWHHCEGSSITHMHGPVTLTNMINSDALGVASMVHPNGLPFLVFRGTSDLDESFLDQVIQDFKFFSKVVDIGGHEVSCTVGFCHAVISNKEQLLHQTKQLLVEAGGATTLLITGHSLGAAMAGIFTAVLKAEMPHLKIKLITFGTPRYGDSRMARLVENSAEYVYRIVNVQAEESGDVEIDPVTVYPQWTNPPAVRIWYQHAGTQMTIGYHDGTKQLPAGFSAVDLHGTLLYVDRIKQLAFKATPSPLSAQLCKKYTEADEAHREEHREQKH